jgi:hypothetical protein
VGSGATVTVSSTGGGGALSATISGPPAVASTATPGAGAYACSCTTQPVPIAQIPVIKVAALISPEIFTPLLLLEICHAKKICRACLFAMSYAPTARLKEKSGRTICKRTSIAISQFAKKIQGFGRVLQEIVS